MSIDKRLRDGLPRNAAMVHPDVESRLDAVLRISRRHARVRWGVGAVVAAAAVLVAVAVGSRLANRADVGPVEDPTTTPTVALSGVYSARVATARLAGRWVLTFASDGTLRVSAPSTYHGVLSGTLFQSTSNTFRTTLFGQDTCSGDRIGTYQWRRSGPILTFTALDDQCVARVDLFAARWNRIR